jgi:hypothetical protein
LISHTVGVSPPQAIAIRAISRPRNAVADHQLRHAADMDGVMGGRGQRQQDAIAAELLVDRDGAGSGENHMTGAAAEQSARTLVAIGAGDEDPLADPGAGIAAGIDHAADRLVPWHERIAHAGEVRHPAGPQQLLGTRGDPAPVDLDPDVAAAHRIEGQWPQREPFWRFQYDRERVHTIIPTGSGSE